MKRNFDDCFRRYDQFVPADAKICLNQHGLAAKGARSDICLRSVRERQPLGSTMPALPRLSLNSDKIGALEVSVGAATSRELVRALWLLDAVFDAGIDGTHGSVADMASFRAGEAQRMASCVALSRGIDAMFTPRLRGERLSPVDFAFRTSVLACAEGIQSWSANSRFYPSPWACRLSS